jgi:beta-xylosidase
LARSRTDQIDGPWEKFPGNPILTDLSQQTTSSGIHGNPDPAQVGNIGLGHADLVVLHGQTILYTSLDGVTRSRLALVWK